MEVHIHTTARHTPAERSGRFVAGFLTKKGEYIYNTRCNTNRFLVRSKRCRKLRKSSSSTPVAFVNSKWRVHFIIMASTSDIKAAIKTPTIIQCHNTIMSPFLPIVRIKYSQNTQAPAAAVSIRDNGSEGFLKHLDASITSMPSL